MNKKMKQKKITLVLLTLLPVILGFLFSLVTDVPVLGTLTIHVLPYMVLVFWFILGREFATTDFGYGKSLLIAHALELVSLLLFLWQFQLATDSTRNLSIAAFSQLYSTATPLVLFSYLAVLFEPFQDQIGLAAMTALQIISLVALVMVFAGGYLFGLYRDRK